MNAENIVELNFIRSSDTSDSYKELDVELSDICKLRGKRTVNVTKSYSHTVSLPKDSIVTVVQRNRDWFVADLQGNYDPLWELHSSIWLEKPRFFQGLVIRGQLHASGYGFDTKYCKELDTFESYGFFHKGGVPVVMASRVVILHNGKLYARGVK